MAKRIESKDLWNEQEIKKSAKSISDAIKDIEKQLGTIVVTLKESKQAFDNQSKSQSEVKKKTEQLTVLDKELIKLDKQLEQTEAKLTNEYQQLQKAVIKKQEAARKNIEAIKNENSLYKQQSARLGELKAKYKDLAAAGKENTDSAKALLSEITELDSRLKEIDASVGNNQRNVGNYASALDILPGKFGNVAQSAKGLVKQFAALLANPIALTIIAIAGAITLLGKAIFSTEKAQRRLEVVQARLSNQWREIKKGIRDIVTGNFSLKEFNKQVEESDRAITSLTEKNQLFNDSMVRTTIEIGKLNKQATVYREIADDSTISLAKRKEFAEKALTAEIELAQKELEVGAEAARLIIERNKLLKQQGELTVTERQEEADAIAKVSELKAKEITTRKRAEREIRDIRLDIFEQELDLLLDISDAQKTVNEQSLNNERKTYLEKLAIIDNTNKIINDSFNQQIKLFNKEFSINLDREKLLKLNNAEIIEYINSLGLSERAVNRLREVIVERRKAQEDLLGTQRDLNEAYRDELNIETEERSAKLQEGLAADNAAFDEWLDKQLQSELDVSNIVDQEIQNRLAAYEEEAKKRAEIDAASKELLKESEKAFTTAVTDNFNAYSDERVNKYKDENEAQKEALKNRLDKGIISESDYQRQLKYLNKQLRIEESKAEKKKAIFDIFINTLVEASKVLSKPVELARVITTGAIQGAAVAAKPVPKFFKGVTDFEGGMAIVGDSPTGGSQTELVRLVSGEQFIVKAPTAMDLPKGTSVFTERSKETREAISKGYSDERIIRGLKNIERKIGGSGIYWTGKGLERRDRINKSTTILRGRRFK